MNNQNLTRLVVATLLATACATAQAESRFQTNALFEPSDRLLVAEASGRVMIYDGLTNDTVNQAMDQQFDRIQNMMFVRTRVTQEDGSVKVEDDCD
jgi:hypothetical protein